MNIANLGYNTIDEIRTLVQLVFDEFGIGQLGSEIRISFNNKFHARMGDASYLRRAIRFSAPLWPRATNQQRRQVIIHEACHVVADYKYMMGQTQDRTSHGPCWQDCMIMCGVEPDRCHEVSTEGLRERISARCACMEHKFTKNRVTKMLRGIVYTCTQCKGPISLGKSG